jgi:hypothetical protein
MHARKLQQMYQRTRIPMPIIHEIAQTMQEVLTNEANQAGRASGFVQRQSKFDGAALVQTLVFSYLSDPNATTDDLAQTAATLGIPITGSGIVQRCTEAAASCLQTVLAQAVQRVLAADPTTVPVVARFSGVYVQDSTTIVLPPDLAPVWRGCGGSTNHGDAALKLQIQLDLRTGHLAGLELQHGRDSDCQSATRTADVIADGLYLADLGYYKLTRFRAIADADAFWLSRGKAGTVLYDSDGQRWDEVTDLLERSTDGNVVDISVEIGARERLPGRLVAVRAPQEVVDQRRRRLRKQARATGKTVGKRRLAWCAWTIFLTNVPADRLTVAEVLTLARARWQIELLIKLWKSHGTVDESRSQKPYRVLCDVYAKLLAMVVQHWLFLVNLWAYPDRSLVKAAKTVKRRAMELASSFRKRNRLVEAITSIGQCITGCRMNRRKQEPTTYQLLLDASLLGIGMPEGSA